MKRKNVVSLSILFIFFLIIFACNPMQPVDLILINGKIVTVDKDFSIANAVAIEKDKIIAVGSNDEIRKLAGSQTKIIDLKGKTVIPGLTDGHLHPETASTSTQYPDSSVDEILNSEDGLFPNQVRLGKSLYRLVKIKSVCPSIPLAGSRVRELFSPLHTCAIIACCHLSETILVALDIFAGEPSHPCSCLT